MWFVFDVESIGLYGEPFAIGWVLVTEFGLDRHTIHSEGLLAIDPRVVPGRKDDIEWVAANVPHIEPTHLSQYDMLESFWSTMRSAMQAGARVAADVPYPVECNALHLCVSHDVAARQLQAPYPLFDIASIRASAGFDPLGTNDRFMNELPLHNPLADARQSARLLLEAVRKLRTL